MGVGGYTIKEMTGLSGMQMVDYRIVQIGVTFTEDYNYIVVI